MTNEEFIEKVFVKPLGEKLEKHILKQIIELVDLVSAKMNKVTLNAWFYHIQKKVGRLLGGGLNALQTTEVLEHTILFDPGSGFPGFPYDEEGEK